MSVFHIIKYATTTHHMDKWTHTHETIFPSSNIISKCILIWMIKWERCCEHTPRARRHFCHPNQVDDNIPHSPNYLLLIIMDLSFFICDFILPSLHVPFYECTIYGRITSSNTYRKCIPLHFQRSTLWYFSSAPRSVFKLIAVIAVFASRSHRCRAPCTHDVWVIAQCESERVVQCRRANVWKLAEKLGKTLRVNWSA